MALKERPPFEDILFVGPFPKRIAENLVSDLLDWKGHKDDLVEFFSGAITPRDFLYRVQVSMENMLEERNRASAEQSEIDMYGGEAS